MKTIENLDIENKTILIRCDFNIPIKDGEIIDETRIDTSLKTINYCLGKNAKLVLFSHLGRIKEESDLEKNNLEIVAKRLEEKLGRKVVFVNETRGEVLETAIKNLESGEVILVQNTRYEDLDGKKESSNDKELGAYWASLGEVFINDAFGTIHRAHASNCGIVENIKEKGIGFLVEEELKALKNLDNPERPFTVILGGAKVKDKIKVIENLVTKADEILIGGGMAFTFLKAKNYEIGKSLLDEDNIEFCKKILEENPDKIILPIDVRTGLEMTNEQEVNIRSIEEISPEEIGLDIGPETEKLYKGYLCNSKLVLWNGPIGMYEYSNYAIGTNEILEFLIKNDIKTILGGGDIVAAAKNQKDKDKIYHISTGGGATLEYLEGKELPGLISIK